MILWCLQSNEDRRKTWAAELVSKSQGSMRHCELFLLLVKTLTSNVILKCMGKDVVTNKAFSWPKANAIRYALPQGAAPGLKLKAGINLHSFLIFALISPQIKSYKVKCRVNNGGRPRVVPEMLVLRHDTGAMATVSWGTALCFAVICCCSAGNCVLVEALPQITT